MGASPGQYAPLILPPSYKRYEAQEGSRNFLDSNALEVNQDGLLLGLDLTFAGTYTTGATAPTPIVGNGAPHNILASVIFSSGGLGQTFYLPGELLHQYNRVLRNGAATAVVGPPATPAASTAYPISFELYLPICVSDPEVFGELGDLAGAIYCADKSSTVRLKFNWRTTAAWASANAGTLTGTMTVKSNKLDTPAPDQDGMLLQAISWYHALMMDNDNALSGVGDQTWQPETQTTRVYMRFLEWFRNNGPDPGVFTAGMLSTLTSKVSGLVTWEDALTEQQVLQNQNRRYGVGKLDAGTYVIDMAASKTRDQWLDVSEISELKLIAQMTAGTVLTNATWQTVAEYLQPSQLAAKFVRSASSVVLKEAGL